MFLCGLCCSLFAHCAMALNTVPPNLSADAQGEASQAQFQWLQQCYVLLQGVVAELEVIAQQSAETNVKVGCADVVVLLLCPALH